MTEAAVDPLLQSFMDRVAAQCAIVAPSAQSEDATAWPANDWAAFVRQPTASLAFGMPGGTFNGQIVNQVLTIAAELGLCVWDAKRSWLWLPDGRSFPLAAAHLRQVAGLHAPTPVAEKKPRKPGRRHWINAAREVAVPLLLEAGFEDHWTPTYEANIAHGLFKRTVDLGEQTIHLFVHTEDKYKPYWVCSIILDYASPPILAAEAQIDDPRRPPQPIGMSLPSFVPGLRGGARIETAEERALFSSYLKDLLLPFTERTRTLVGLRDSVLADPVIRRNAGASFAFLLLAKLTHHTNMDELVEAYLRGPKMASNFEDLYAETFKPRLDLLATVEPLPQYA